VRRNGCGIDDIAACSRVDDIGQALKPLAAQRLLKLIARKNAAAIYAGA
jgi:hypothetical protein